MSHMQACTKPNQANLACTTNGTKTMTHPFLCPSKTPTCRSGGSMHLAALHCPHPLLKPSQAKFGCTATGSKTTAPHSLLRCSRTVTCGSGGGMYLADIQSPSPSLKPSLACTANGTKNDGAPIFVNGCRPKCP